MSGAVSPPPACHGASADYLNNKTSFHKSMNCLPNWRARLNDLKQSREPKFAFAYEAAHVLGASLLVFCQVPPFGCGLPSPPRGGTPLRQLRPRHGRVVPLSRHAARGRGHGQGWVVPDDDAVNLFHVPVLIFFLCSHIFLIAAIFLSLTEVLFFFRPRLAALFRSVWTAQPKRPASSLSPALAYAALRK